MEVTGTVATLVSAEPVTVPNDVLTIVDSVVKVVRTKLPSVNEGAIVWVTGSEVVSVKTVENVVPEWTMITVVVCVEVMVLCEVVLNVVVVGGTVTTLVIRVVLVEVTTMLLVCKEVVVINLKLSPIMRLAEAGSMVLIVELPETRNIFLIAVDDDLVGEEDGDFNFGTLEVEEDTEVELGVDCFMIRAAELPRDNDELDPEWDGEALAALDRDEGLVLSSDVTLRDEDLATVLLGPVLRE